MVSASIAVLAAAVAAAPAPAAAQRGPEAYFALRSYAPGSTATLEVAAPRGRVTVQIFRVWARRRARCSATDVMAGVPVSDPRDAQVARRRRLPLAAGRDPVLAERALLRPRLLEQPGTCFAPFVVRAGGIARTRRRRPADEHLAGVQQARRRRRRQPRQLVRRSLASRTSARRPFLDRGVPPHFRQYDLGFLRWLAHTGKQADFLADDDLERVLERPPARACVRPDRLRGPRGVRDGARVRPGHGATAMPAAT